MIKKKRKILAFLFMVTLGILCTAVIAGVGFYNYLSNFSNKANKGKIVQPIEAKNDEEPINILIMGLDIGIPGEKCDNDSKRTDTILLFNYNPKNKTGNIVSVPRDTLITINGKNEKINAANAIGGVSYLIYSIENMFDLKINYYARVDYNGFRKLIDAIGGIDMQISYNMNYDDDLQNLHIHFNKGQFVHLDGEKAEEYFRWRKNNDGSGLGTGDLGRIENQHVFIEKVIEKVDSVAVIPKIPKILGILPQYIDTNMSAKDLLKYGSAICTLKKDNITLSTVKGDLCDIEGISYVAYNDKLNQGIINSLHSK